MGDSNITSTNQNDTTNTTTTTNNTTKTGTFQIHYFASAASYTKKVTESLPAPLPLGQLFRLLEDRYPGIRESVLRSCSVSLGLEYVDVEDEDQGQGQGQDENENANNNGIVIQVGDEVGIIPPVSSG